MLAASRFSGRFTQLLLLAAVLLVLTVVFYSRADSIRTDSHVPILGSEKTPPPPPARHPIDDLREGAEREYKSLLAKESHTLGDAAHAYEQRRGRRPPPGFDVWYEFARNNSGLVVEDFFDRIYQDLNPFWAIPALTIRQQAGDLFHRISIRNGTTFQTSDQPRIWLDLWEDLIGTIVHLLPDLDIPINVMDESRVVVPWETISECMIAEEKTRRIVPASEIIQSFNKTSVGPGEEVPQFDAGWHGYGPYWDKAVVGCHPDSPARHYTPEVDYTRFPPLNNTYPVHSYKGYVTNWTLTKSPCDNPTLQGLHGTFVEPISISNTDKLIPIFGGSKLPVNNEILIPPAMYWTKDPFYSGGKNHGGSWDSKYDTLIWRGAASGGRNKDTTWTRFQRHRFVSMVNSTSVAFAEQSGEQRNFELPKPGTYGLSDGDLAEWVGTFGDAAFVHLVCFPDQGLHCDYTDPFYEVAGSMPMKKQYDNKYLPDIDGNSFSGRYRGFLGSTSLPIKATIYDEWHDSRLVPWKHFVPMDNTFIDIYGIMAYFLGGRDEAGKQIAMDGKEWTEKVLRREDMQIYVLRLLLEYARLCDDNRERLGWVGKAGAGAGAGVEVFDDDTA